MSTSFSTAITGAESLLHHLKAHLSEVLFIKKARPAAYESYLLDDNRTLVIYSAFCFHVFQAALVTADLPEGDEIEICSQAARDYLLSEKGALGPSRPTLQQIEQGEALADDDIDADTEDKRWVRSFAACATDNLVLGYPDTLLQPHYLTEAVLCGELLR